MGSNSLLRERAGYEKMAAYVIEVLALAGFAISIAASVLLVERLAIRILAGYFITLGIGLFLSRYDVVKNAVVIFLTIVMFFAMLALTTPFMFILQGITGVKKYWKIQLKHCIKVLMAR